MRTFSFIFSSSELAEVRLRLRVGVEILEMHNEPSGRLIGRLPGLYHVAQAVRDGKVSEMTQHQIQSGL